MKKVLIIGLIFILIAGFAVNSFAEAPSLDDPLAESAEPTLEPTPTPSPTPAPTMAVLETEIPNQTEVPTETPAITPEESAQPGITPKPGDKNDDSKKSEGNGKVVFWSIVSCAVGIWIGIIIGAVTWRKKSVFMTDKEKKIIGRL